MLGKIEWIATIVIPGAVVASADPDSPSSNENPARYYGKRVLPISVLAIVVVGIVTLTLMADIPTVTPEGSVFPGVLQAIAGLIIPGLGFLLLFLMAFAFRNVAGKP